MREKSVVGRIKPVARRESDAMEIDTEVPTVSKTSTVDPNTTATPQNYWRGWWPHGVDNRWLTCV